MDISIALFGFLIDRRELPSEIKVLRKRLLVSGNNGKCAVIVGTFQLEFE